MTIAETHSTRTHHSRRHHRVSAYIEAPAPEPKWLDTTGTPIITITTTPLILNLTEVVQGPGQNQRIGDSIKCASQFYRMTMARGTVDQFFRCIHFLWRGDDVPPAASILQVPNQVVSPLNRDFSKTYKILRDDLYTLGSGESQLQVKKEFWDMKCTTKYTSDGDTSQTFNQLFVLFMSDQPTSATAPIINYYHRLTYTDC